MSRIGKKPIAIPANTTVKLENGVFSVKGPQGELSRAFRSDIVIDIGEKEITLAPKRETIETRALWGTYASHIGNMIDGVNKAFEKKLVIEGVGYKWDSKTADEFKAAYKKREEEAVKKGDGQQVRVLASILRKLNELNGKLIELSLGLSHPVFLKIPEGISVTIEKNVMTITGIDKDQLGQFAAEIRKFKEPEPYKGKGIQYQGQPIRRKQGKKTA